MEYRLLALDFDGTLADSLQSFLACLRVAARRHGFRAIEDGMVDTVRGLSSRQLMRALGVPLWKVPAIAADMRREMASRVAGVPLFPGIGDALRQLRAAGAALAVATSNSRDNVLAVMGEAAVHVDHFSCGIPLFGKPRRLRALAREYGIVPAQLLYVGDEIRDAEAARAAGCGFQGVSWGYTRPEVLQRHCALPLLARPEQLLQLPLAAGAATLRSRRERPFR